MRKERKTGNSWHMMMLVMVVCWAWDVEGQISEEGMDPIVTTETIVRDGVTFVRNAVPIPTGKIESSGLLLEKILPAEVSLGTEFTYEYRVQNLTPHPMIDVAIHDKTSSHFEFVGSTPMKPVVSDHSVATWFIGNLGPRESKIVQVEGKAMKEGEITTRGWATFQAVMFDRIKVTRAELEMTISAPQVSLVSQPIRYEVKVKNTGSSNLSNVVISGEVPDNLKSFTGSEKVEYLQSFLSPGNEMNYVFELQPQVAGEYTLELAVVSSQGAKANSEHITEVRAPSLQITAASPEERFIGRDVLVNIVIENKGNAPSRNAQVSLSVPAGVFISDVTDGGRQLGNFVQWELLNLAAGDVKELSLSARADSPGDYQFISTVSAEGQQSVTASTDVKFIGIPAIALEVRDLKDPVPINEEFVYEITVTNQGTAPASNVRIICELEDSQEYVSSYGESAARLGNKRELEGKIMQEIIMEPLVRIDPKKSVNWRVSVRAVKKGDVRFSVRMSSDQFPRPTNDVEPTYQY